MTRWLDSRIATLPLPIAELERVLLPLERARGLPSAAYFSEEVFAFERHRLFGRCWTCVGRDCELDAPGAFLLARVGGEELLLVRGVDLELRAMYNVCQHRGLRLVEAERGVRGEFSCPYHGWIYELSGALRSAPHAPPAFERHACNLGAVRVASLHGFVFVCLDGETPLLENELAHAPDWLTRPELRHLRLGRSKTYPVAANWKLCIENFQESLHFPGVHRELERQTPSARATSWRGSGKWLGGKMELAAGLRTVSARREGTARPFIVPESNRGEVRDAIAFPLLLTSLQPDYLLSYHLHPESPSRTLVTANTYFHAAAFAPEPAAGDVYEFWDRVNAEDRAICERQQLGVRSRGFRTATYSLVEDGVHAFDQLVARCYLEPA